LAALAVALLAAGSSCDCGGGAGADSDGGINLPADASKVDAGSAGRGDAAATVDAGEADGSSPAADAATEGRDADAPGPDSGEPAADGSAAAPDAGLDAGSLEPPDASLAPGPDAAEPPGPDAGPASAPDGGRNGVDIYVSNTCVMDVVPKSITLPAGTQNYFTWNNRSADYPVDVWMSYGGGYTDLAPGSSWVEPIAHCSVQSVHDEYADISTACSSYRFYFHCR
jgi:hypothetical protein